MKIIHIMNNSTFTAPFIKFINNNFDKNKHIFLIIGKKNKFNIEKVGNIFFIKNIKDILSFIKNVKNSDKIIFHGLFSKKIILFLFVFRNILKKSYWVIWGGDLYHYKFRDKNLKSNLHEFLRKKVIRSMGNIIPVASEYDYDLAKKWYKTKAKNNYAFYPNPVNYEYLDTINDSKKNENELYIQIGNSADPSNKHIEIFEYLSKFKDKNIKIYCPLSYGGNVDYISEVVEKGEQIFGEKFIPMTRFIKAEEYGNFLSSIDVAIFNHDRQQAVGNILALLYLGKKIYIKNDITTWKTMQSKKLKVHNTYDLKNESFEIFSDFKNIYKIKNKEIIRNEYSTEKCVFLWNEIFNK